MMSLVLSYYQWNPFQGKVRLLQYPTVQVLPSPPVFLSPEFVEVELLAVTIIFID